MPRILFYVAIVSVLTCTAHAQYISFGVDHQISGKPQNSDASQIKIYEELFKKSFEHQRKEHAKAVKRLQKIDNYERLYKMILVIGEKMIDAIEVNKALIANEDFNPDNRLLPQNVTIQTAISTVLENTAFFGDILLHFPHFTHRILKAQQKWNPIINWSLNFTYRTKYLLDSETIVKIHLASQELNVIKREQGYSNPYWQPTEAQEGDNGKTKKKKSATKGKQKKGPQMTKKDGWSSSSKLSEEYLKIVKNPDIQQTLLETTISFSANKSEDFSDDGDGAVVESGQPMS